MQTNIFIWTPFLGGLKMSFLSDLLGFLFPPETPTPPVSPVPEIPEKPKPNLILLENEPEPEVEEEGPVFPEVSAEALMKIVPRLTPGVV
jgi:hypothetical protein